jgi:hypothetical protein
MSEALGVMLRELSSEAMDALNAACEEESAAAADVALARTKIASFSLQKLRYISRPVSLETSVALELAELFVRQV